MGKLDGQVAAISGGPRVIGRAIAEAYAQEGAIVVSNCQARERAAVEAVIDQAVHDHGRLDVVVLDAGGACGSEPVATMSDHDWQRVLDLNLNHVFRGIRRALHHMLPRRNGRIVVSLGVEAKLPRAGASGYVAALHGTSGLVKSVAREVGTHGIAVNAILPGSLDVGAPEHLQVLSKLGRPTTVEEVARVAVLLASPQVSSITGCMFPVDGGTMPY